MSDWRLTPQNAALVVIDVQEKLMNVMPRRSETLAAIQKTHQRGKRVEAADARDRAIHQRPRPGLRGDRQGDARYHPPGEDDVAHVAVPRNSCGR